MYWVGIIKGRFPDGISFRIAKRWVEVDSKDEAREKLLAIVRRDYEEIEPTAYLAPKIYGPYEDEFEAREMAAG